MTNKLGRRVLRTTASILCLAILHASFGLEAWAQVAPVGAVFAPVGSGAAGASALSSLSPAAARTGGTVSAASLSGSALSLSAPAAGLARSAAFAAPSAAPVAAPAAAARFSAPSAAAAPAASAGSFAPSAAPAASAESADKPAALAASGSAAADSSRPAAEVEAAPAAPNASAFSARVAQRFAALRAAWTGRGDAGAMPASAADALTGARAADSAPSGLLAPSAAAGDAKPADQVPAPAQTSAAAPNDGAKGKLGRYVLASNLSQAGYEGLASASMPVYLDQTFHKISLMADLSILGTFSSIVGRQLSPLIVNALPLKKAYIGALGATFATALVIGVLANVHLLTILPLYGLMVLFRLTQGAAAVAERAVIPSVLGKDQVAMEKLRGSKQSWAEVASVLTQNGAATLVVILGTATTNMIIAPWLYLVAIGLLFTSLKIPKSADEARLAASRERAANIKGGVLGRVAAAFKNFGSQVAKGYTVVMHDPALRSSTMVTTLMIVFNVAVYSILAPTFGKFAVGPGAASSLAAPIMGLIAGLFSFGGLFAGKLVNKHARDVAAKYGADAAGAEEAARASTMRWLKYGALSFLAVGAMALPLPAIAPLIALGTHASIVVTAVLGTGTILSMWKPKLGLALALTPVLLAFPAHVALAAVAFFAFGMLQVVAALKNDSLFDKLAQERAPADYANAAAFNGAFAMFAAVLGLTALKFLIYGSLPFGIPSPIPAFVGLPGIWPFVAIFAGLAVPAMLAMLHFTRRLDRLTTPAPPAKP